MHARREMTATDTMQASMLAVPGVAKPVGQVRVEILGVVLREVTDDRGVDDRGGVIIEVVGGPGVSISAGIRQ